MRFRFTLFFFFILHLVLFLNPNTYGASGKDESDPAYIRSQVDRFIRMANDIRDSSISLYYQYGMKALVMSKPVNYKKGEADALQCIGNFYLSRKNYLQALESHFESKKIYESIGCDSGTIESTAQIGLVFNQLRRYDRAVSYLQKANNLARSRNDTNAIILISGSLGDVFLKTGDTLAAYQCHMDALNLANKCRTEFVILLAYRSAGTFYMQTGELDKAQFYYNEVVRYCLKHTKAPQLGSMYTLLAHAFQLDKDYKSSLKYNILASKYRKQSNQLSLYASSLLNIGYSYFLLKKYDSCYYFLKSGLALAEDLNEKGLQAYGYRHLFEYYEHMNDWKNALGTFRMYSAASDSVEAEEKRDVISQFEVNKTLSESESNNELLRNEISIQKLNLRIKNQQIFLLFVFIFLSIIFTSFIYRLYIRNKKSRQELKKINDQLDKEIGIRKKIEDDLRESEELHRFLTDNSLDVIVQIDRSLRIIYVSPSCKNLFGYDQAELLGMKYPDSLIHPEDIGKVKEEVDKMIHDKMPTKFTFLALHKSGASFWAESHINPIFDDHTGELIELLSVVRDFSTHVEHEKMLMENANQKEVMVSEIHHRVKNYFAILASLMDLEKREAAAEAHKPISNLKYRVKTMGLIHDQLYNSRNISNLSFSEFLKQLSGEISSAMMKEGVRIYTEIDDCHLHVKTAMPLGLIVNELLINSFKYAFNGREKGCVHVIFRLLNNNEVPPGDDLVYWELTVKDDGIGLPEGFDPAKTKSLGMRIVKMLTDQVDASMVVTGKGGTCFVITNKK